MLTRKIVVPLLLGVCASALPGQVVITNPPSSIRANTYYNFTVTLNGTKVTTGITWTVNGIAGGNGTVGTFSGFRYNAPAFPPGGATVTIAAISTQNPALSDNITVTIDNPVPSLSSVLPSPLPQGPATLTMNGYGFVNGAVVYFNGAAQPTTYVSPTRLTIATNLQGAITDDTAIYVVNPDPGSAASNTLLVPPPTQSGPAMVSDAAARRFLEQAAFGPDLYSMGRLQKLGFEGWIDEQVNEPRSTYPDPANIPFSMAPVQARFFSNAVNGRDQLRQRVALALHKIWVVSSVEENDPKQMIPYLQIFSDLAFDNYRNIMRKVTLNPAMGDYLDMRNNVKANAAGTVLPNENYAREIMQLFTIGLWQLNPDGTQVLDAMGNPVPTYTQSTIAQFARVYTGWTYPPAPGAASRAFNPPYYNGDMVVGSEANHDTGSKTLLNYPGAVNGGISPQGLSASDDLDWALDNIFNHPNVGPFVATNLIKELVTSNPSPAYVARVAAVFNNNGAGVRGDMLAVIKAVLLDPEARQGDDLTVQSGSAYSSYGALKEPVLFFAQTMRGLGAIVNDSNTLAARASALGENIFFPPTVFSYFSPFYEVQSTGLAGPEFQLDTRSAAIERANQINTLIYGSYGAGATLDLTPWAALASNPSYLADTISWAFLYGTAPTEYRNQLLSAITGTSGTNLQKTQAALYVALTSGYYAVKK